MLNNNSYSPKKDLRNTTTPYTIHLRERVLFLDGQMLKNHIDMNTLTYKEWHFPKLKVISFKEGLLKLSNINYNMTYELTIDITHNGLHISCNCDRRVEKLCHHAYYALAHIISTLGEQYFIAGPYTNFIEIEQPYSREDNTIASKKLKNENS
jgi:hypothetical protein